MHKLFFPLVIILSFLNCKKTNSKKDIKIPPGNVVLYVRSIGGGYANPPTGYGIYTNSDTGGTERPLIESSTFQFSNPTWAKNNKIYWHQKYFIHCLLFVRNTQQYFDLLSFSS